MYESLKAKNAKRWADSKVTKYYPSIVKKIFANKTRYQAVEAKTGVPWPVIAVIHVREADMNFNTQLAQGDPLSRVSTHVPRGQGPYTGPNAWENAAVRALKDTGGPSWKDWTPGGWTTFLEKYNGFGYSRMGRPSPYVWGGTNQYTSGKYVSDGKYDAGTVDSQPGCASLIGQLAVIDKTINPEDLSKKSNVIVHTTAGTVVAAGAAAVATAPHHIWPWVLGGSCLAVALGLWAYLYFKGKK